MWVNFKSSVACLYWNDFSFGLFFIVVSCAYMRFLSGRHLVQCISLMNCLFQLLPGKLNFLSYILLYPGGMLLSFNQSFTLKIEQPILVKCFNYIVYHLKKKFLWGLFRMKGLFWTEVFCLMSFFYKTFIQHVWLV